MPDHDHPAYEYARQIWTYIAGQNAAKTARILAEPPGEYEDADRPVFSVSDRTIRYWARKYKWQQQAEKDLKKIAPAVHAQVTRELILGSIAAAQYVRDVAEGRSDADKNRITNAFQLLDRAGHLPHSRPKDDTKPLAPQLDHGASVAGLPIDKLLEKALGHDDE